MLYGSDYIPLMKQEGGLALKLGEKLWLGDSTVYFVVNSAGALELVSTSIAITGTFTLGPLDIDAGTQTVSNPLFDGTATWNAGGITFETIFCNITDTASAAGSRLIELQVGSAEKFGVTKAGAGTFASSMTAKNAIITQGTLTDALAILASTATWNHDVDTMLGISLAITDTASHAASAFEKYSVGGVDVWNLNKNGKLKVYGGAAPTDGQLLIGSTANVNFTAGTLTGTSNQVIVTNASNTVTLSLPQNIHNAAKPTFGSMALTQGTITLPSPNLSGTVTWNAGAEKFTGFFLDVTDTASTATSMLMDLQIGGAPKFNVLKSGNMNCGTIGVTGGTVTANDPCLEMDQTWNDAGVVFIGIDLDVVSTASDATSMFLNFKLSTVSKFSVKKDGVCTAAGFSGPLTGNVTGNASGSSGSCTGNAATATTAGNYTGLHTGMTLSSAQAIDAPGGTAWADTEGGILLAESLSAKTFRIKLPVKAGSVLKSYKIKGKGTSAGNTYTLDCSLKKVIADGTISTLAGGAMVQVSKTADYAINETTTITAYTVVAGDAIYVLFTGTTAAATTIKVNNIELTYDEA